MQARSRVTPPPRSAARLVWSNHLAIDVNRRGRAERTGCRRRGSRGKTAVIQARLQPGLRHHWQAAFGKRVPDELYQLAHDPDCLTIRDRTASRTIRCSLPNTLPAGRYRFRVDFCRRPLEQMPLATVSNAIEVLPGRRNAQ